ncbi:phosphoribosylanthranilate isomerase [Sphaerochaeta pleomorpha str. Grapes]|uniref:N-(5'-phosphoribosyl)anthranilate isomerase n=1 Tax=Sphaerochaeta pleomorpha (strain ATCC BAA-1885 / DSM 22778 / Grapes) TaxID=158190 RepID=G8QQT4_SPHPG|nr:phosphoribosylanthranilate isomerase [Sphaerochaeta pleomorpha]AEV28715.1 phosphoribosylanthranilate isomerase [Sphaerochaeta pleomorpha str. Grapes]
MTKIKLCGLRGLQDIAYANKVNPDFVGFVFAKSKRQISPQLAMGMRLALHKEIVSVGVFVNEQIATICALVESGTIAMVQLHGDENEQYIHALKRELSVPVIKVVSITCKESLLPYLSSPADYLLLDAGKGGTGMSFDWSLAQICTRPFFLAGGLNSENLQKAIATTHPFAVDLSSGLEKGGRKDFSLMQQAVSIAHRCNYLSPS